MMNILQRLLVTFVAFTSSLGFGSVSVTHAATTLDANQYVIFYHSDLLGSPAVVTDHNGNTLWHEHSDPYGRARDRITETRKVLDHDRAGSRKGYTGHLKDEGSNLVYMKARFYDPQIGRFYSNDPIGFSASNPSMFNRYSYANNNPYRYTDPFGMEGEEIQEEIQADIDKSRESYFGIFSSLGSIFSSGADIADDMAVDAYGGNGPTAVAATWIGHGALKKVKNAIKWLSAKPSVDPARLHHIFDKPEHVLDDLVNEHGSQERAFNAIQDAANKALKEGKIITNSNGIIPTGDSGPIVNVGGTQVRLIGGRVIDGVVRLSSASRQGL